MPPPVTVLPFAGHIRACDGGCFLQNLSLWTATVITSNNDGSPRKVISQTFSTVGAKTMEMFLFVSEVDSDTQIVVKWSKSADGVNWYDLSTAMVDTGAGANAATGVYIGNNGSELLGGFCRAAVTIQKRNNAILHTATVALNAVLKPF